MPVSSTSFDQRLARISKARGGNLGYATAERTPSVFVGLASGLMGYLIFCLAAWHGMERTPLQLATLEDLGILLGGALAGGWVVRALLNIRGKGVMRNHAIGLLVGFAGLHMAVHAVPDHFERAFAPEWVQETLVQTEPKLMTPNAGLMAAQTIVMDAIKEFEESQELAANL